MLAPLIVAIYLSMLKYWLIKLLALLPLWMFQMSIQMIDMSDFGNTLMTCVLWQSLNQCPIAAQAINLIEEISSREYELCNLQENSTGNHNSILSTIYISNPGPCYDCALSYPNVYTLSS